MTVMNGNQTQESEEHKFVTIGSALAELRIKRKPQTVNTETQKFYMSNCQQQVTLIIISGDIKATLLRNMNKIY